MNQLEEWQLHALLYGTGREKVRFRYTDMYKRTRTYEVPFEGVIPNLERRYQESQSDSARSEIQLYMSNNPCPACKGARLKPEAWSSWWAA